MIESIIKFFNRTAEVKEALKRAHIMQGGQEIIFAANSKDREILKKNLQDVLVQVV